MKIQSITFLFILILFIGQSCRPTYIPNMQNVPLMKEKNEIRSSITPRNFQASYAITDEVAIMANGQIENTDNSNPTYGEDDNGKKHLIEMGLGYFHPLKKSAVFEIYGGAGLGRISFNNQDNRGRDKFSADYTRYFVQSNFGFSQKIFDLAFSVRMVHLHFYNADTSEYIFEQSTSTSRDLAQLDQHSYVFVEPAITLRLGWKYVKMHWQLQQAVQMNSAPINFQEFRLNVGLHITIARRYRSE